MRAGAEVDELLRVLVQEAPTQLPAQRSWGVTDEVLHRDPERALSTVVERYHDVARLHDTVLVVGTDFTGVPAPTEFTTNASIAANIGTPMLLVVPARHRTAADVAASAAVSVAAARHEHAHVAGVIANQVPEARRRRGHGGAAGAARRPPGLGAARVGAAARPHRPRPRRRLRRPPRPR